jgi:hypothetical protein
MRYLLFLLLTTFSLTVSASLDANVPYDGWHTKDGKPLPNTDNRKSINGFGGWLIITPDADWKEKWETPTYVSPHFNEASEVEYGQHLAILTFFINPLKDESGNVDIACSVKIIRPDKSISTSEKISECIKGPFPGDTHHVYLSPVVIEYSGDVGDLPGEWIVEVNLTDNIRGSHVPLMNRFTLVEANRG